MSRITHELLRKRAEHNEGIVATLEEVSLHQQDLTRIENLGIMCRHLKILYLQNNVICKLENLHRLKELEYLNMAINNIQVVENLQRCESLTKLDLTLNFVPKQGLLSLPSLRTNIALRELFLVGNPCADWEHYRCARAHAAFHNLQHSHTLHQHHHRIHRQENESEVTPPACAALGLLSAQCWCVCYASVGCTLSARFRS